MKSPDAVLFVCTGNICRSPMAEYLFRRLIEEAGGGPRWRVASCGVYPVLDRATAPAQRVMRERGLDLSAHRSRPLVSALLTPASLVLTMERSHQRHELLRGHPGVFTLHHYASGGQVDRDIADPYGGTIEEYRACAAEIDALLPAVLARLAAGSD